MPAGTTLFDCASWNGVAIDSTCGGHGTCKKCKVRVASGRQDAVVGRPSRVLARRAEGRLAARLPRSGRGGSRGRGAAAADAAEGGARRRRPARDPQAGRAEAPSRADRAHARGSDLGSRTGHERDGRRRAPRAARARACARQDTARRELECDRGRRRRPAARRRARRHDGAPPRDRVRPRHDHLRRDAARPRDRPAGRGALDSQRPAAVRRGCDLADQRDDARSGRAGRAPCQGTRDARDLDRRGVRGGGRRPRRGLRDRRRRERDDDPARARDRPRAALDGAVHDRRAPASGRHGSGSRCAGARARARRAVPGARRLRRARHRRRHPGDGPDARQATYGSSSTSAPTRRSCSGRPHGHWRRRRRPGRRSKRPRSAAACVLPTGRSKA